MTRRKTDDQKRVEGTYRPDRARPTETMAAVLLPPSTLPAAAQAVWRRVEPQLRAAGILHVLDRDALALFSVLQARLDTLYQSGEVPGRDLVSAVTRLMQRLGLDPDSRKRLAISAPPAPRPRGKYDDV